MSTSAPPPATPPTPSVLPGRCLLLEDQRSTREWLTQVVLSAFPGIEIVAAGMVREAHAQLDLMAGQQSTPLTLAILDIGLPYGSGVEIIRRISLEWPQALPVVATIYSDDAHVFDAISAGARGYILKDEDGDITRSVSQAHRAWRPPLAPSIAHRAFSPISAVRLQQERTSEIDRAVRSKPSASSRAALRSRKLPLGSGSRRKPWPVTSRSSTRSST